MVELKRRETCMFCGEEIAKLKATNLALLDKINKLEEQIDDLKELGQHWDDARDYMKKQSAW